MTLLWNGDLSTGDFSQYVAVQDSTTNAAGWGSHTLNEIVTSTRPGVAKMQRSTVFGDTDGGSSGPRAEIYTDSFMTEGVEFYLGFSFMWPTQAAFASAGQHAIMQFKNEGTGSPPIDMDVRNFSEYGAGSAGGLYLSYSTGNSGVLDAGIVLLEMANVCTGIWHDICFHVISSSNSSIGFLECWLDGTLKLSTHAMTLRSGLNSYFKCGLYGPSGAGDNTHIAYHAAMARGTTRADADPFLRFSGGTVPSTPTGLAAVAGNGQVSLSWNSASGASTYKVYRNGTGTGTPIYTGSNLNFVDTGLTNGTTYTYTVRASNSTGDSPPSSSVSSTPTLPPVPSPPTLSATPGNTKVTLSWTSSSGATSYKLYRNGTGTGTPIYTGSTTNYTDTGLTNGTSYTYTVRATNASGDSSISNVITSTPQGSILGSGSVYLDGNRDYMTFLNGLGYNGTGAFTCVFVANPDVVTKNMIFLTGGSTTANGDFSFRDRQNFAYEPFTTYMGSGSDSYSDTSGTTSVAGFIPGSWTINAVTKASGTIAPTFHRGTSHVGGSAIQPNASAFNQAIYIGGRPNDSTLDFQGKIAAIAWWNSVLSNSQLEGISRWVDILALNPVSAIRFDDTAFGFIDYGSSPSTLGTVSGITHSTDEPTNFWASTTVVSANLLGNGNLTSSSKVSRISGAILTGSSGLTGSINKSFGASATLTASGVLNASTDPALFPTTGILDDFNRADISDISGTNWTNDDTSDYTGLEITSGYVTTNSTSPGHSSWVAAVGPDSEVYATVKSIAQIELWARSSATPANIGGFESIGGTIGAFEATGKTIGQFEAGGGSLIGYNAKFVGGVVALSRMDPSSTVLGSTNLTLSVGDKVGLRCLGSNIEVWYKPSAGVWSRKLLAIDSGYPGSGHIGLTLYSNAAVDDFSGGNYVPITYQNFSSSLTANGSFSATGRTIPSASSSLNASGSLSAQSGYKRLGSAIISGSGRYSTVSGTLKIAGRSSLNGQTTASFNGAPLGLPHILFPSEQLYPSSLLYPSQKGLLVSGYANLSGYGIATGTGLRYPGGQVSLSGSGSLISRGGVKRIFGSSLSGAGTTNAKSLIRAAGVASLGTQSNFTSSGKIYARGLSSVSGISSLVSNGTRIQNASSNLSSQSSIGITTNVIYGGRLSISGTGGLLSATAGAGQYRFGIAQLFAESNVVPNSSVTYRIRIDMAGQSLLNADYLRITPSYASFAGISNMANNATSLLGGIADISLQSALQADGLFTLGTKAMLFGTSQIEDLGSVIQSVRGELSMSGSLSAVAYYNITGRASLASANRLTSTGRAIRNSIVSLEGISGMEIGASAILKDFPWINVLFDGDDINISDVRLNRRLIVDQIINNISMTDYGYSSHTEADGTITVVPVQRIENSSLDKAVLTLR